MASILFLALLGASPSILAEASPPADFNCSIPMNSYPESSGYGTPANFSKQYATLVNCPDTKSLHLHSASYNYGQGFQEDPLNFKFLSGDRFPALHELSLDGYDLGDYRPFREEPRRDHPRAAMKPMILENADANYLPASQTVYIPGANLDAWKQAMDWTALQRLQLVNVDNIFFWKMKGHLPSVKHLWLRDNYGRNDVSTYMTDFINSLNSLTNISAVGYTGSVDWSQVLERHGPTLERLEIGEWNAAKIEDARPTFSFAQLEEISHACPRLSELSVNVKMDTEIPEEILDALASFKNVSKLTIRLRSNQQMPLTEGSEQDDLFRENGINYESLMTEADHGKETFISPLTILKIFQDLRLKKQGVELQQLEAHVGNHETRWISRTAHLGWVEGYNSLPSKHVCSVINEEGNRKLEGEAWCHCDGECTRRQLWF